MSCRCGHVPRHYGCAYPPTPYTPDPPRRGRRTRIEGLEEHLSDLVDELARVREELAEYRRDGGETG